MRVLITGASGYTGVRLTKALLAAGHSVRALVHTPAKAAMLRALGARVVIGDLTNLASIAGIATNIELIYHLAGTLSGGSEGIRRVQVDGTRNLLHECRVAQAGGRDQLRSFVYAGNAAVYGDGAGKQLTEETPCRPSFPLGRICLLAEELLRQTHAEFALPVVTLRVGAIYGPERLSSALVREGRFRIIGSGSNYISRIHIDDLIDILVKLREGAPSSLYCVADEQPATVDEYYGTLATLMGVAPPPHLPIALANLRGLAHDLGARTRGRATGTDATIIGLFTSDQRIDSSKIRWDLQLRLQYRSYREGLPAALAEEGSSPYLAGYGELVHSDG